MKNRWSKKFPNFRTPEKNLSDLVSRTPRFENAQIHFFWKPRDLKNTLRKGVKNGVKFFGCKGGTLWSQFFRSVNFDHLPYESAQKGVPKNLGVDTGAFPPTNEQKNGRFWRFLTIFFSFFKNWFFWSNSRDDSPKNVGKKRLFFPKTHQYISEEVRPQKCKNSLNRCILACALSHRNTQSHQYHT